MLAACQPARYATREPARGLAFRVNLLGGMAFAPLLLMRERRLLQARVPWLHVEWKVLPAADVVHEALLTGGLDVALGAPTAFLRFRERLLRDGRQAPPRVLAAASELPCGVLANRPEARALADLGPTDRIAVPDPVGHEATAVRLAALRELGDGRALDGRLVAVPPGEAFGRLRRREGLAAMAAATPYLDVGRDTVGLRRLTDPAAGPPLTALLAYALPAARERHRPLFDAFADALAEASALVGAEPVAAARLLDEAADLDLSPPTLAGYLARPGVRFGTRVRGLVELTRFLALTGHLGDGPVPFGELAFEGVDGD